MYVVVIVYVSGNEYVCVYCMGLYKCTYMCVCVGGGGGGG